jgi:hypothetical protein
MNFLTGQKQVLRPEGDLMNEERAEDMKTQFERRQMKVHARPDLRLAATPRKESLFIGVRAAIKRFFSKAHSDLDFESWQRLEHRSEYQEKRDPKNIDIHRWM